jgi:hypothetical protein
MLEEDEKQSSIALLREIIRSEMVLKDEQIAVYNQNWILPKDDGIHLTVQFIGAQPFSNRNWVDPTGAIEVQDVSMQEMYQIKVMSRNDEALFRKHEVLMAVASIYSQQIQEANSFKIAPISHGFNDVSEVEGVARINVYVLTVSLLAWYQKTKTASYYDSFTLKARTDKIAEITADQNVPS